uniref:Uncharacterized protein n=1 Tax=Rhizobium leguminosarum TaxID=384 RepID=A0A154I915_RHILE|nr:hypothetical protein A4A59_05235 [Rhizobium leguminosarum]
MQQVAQMWIEKVNNKQANIAALSSVLLEMIADDPYERDGFVWAAATQPEFCASLGWSISKFYRVTGLPPFVRDVRKIDGIRKTILRVGEPGLATHEKIAKEMSSRLRSYRLRSRKALIAERNALAGIANDTDANVDARIEKIEHLLQVLPRMTTGDEFGHMCGFAKIWPQGYQIAIFKAVLADWPAFMAAMKMQIWTTGKGEEKFFEFVSTGVMRAFPQAAVELYVMQRQEQATELTPELRRLSRYTEG